MTFGAGGPRPTSVWLISVDFELQRMFLVLDPKNEKQKHNSRWWFWNIFYFHPYLRKIPILTSIFQVGWNHQLDVDGNPMLFSNEKSYTKVVSCRITSYSSQYVLLWDSSEVAGKGCYHSMELGC